ncbi:unnamed protein product [Rotaria sordida]|uniref:Uncharacterized protein n=1 Tax=Rotaria sordida TaxID=392033 RepID=A0A814VXD8_9BILA|nr:unnamed protein product [Rotaria sordida]
MLDNIVKRNQTSIFTSVEISYVKLSIWSCLLYIAASIGSLFFITMPVLRSKLSRLVEPNEYAIVFIAAAFIEAGGDKAIDAASNSIYNASLRFWPGLVFFVLALLGIFPLLIMSYLAYTEKKTITIMATDSGVKV